MGRKKEYDSDDLVESCTNLFWARGFNGTSVGDLVKESGVSRSSLYKEFDGKDGLYFDLVKTYSERNMALLQELMASELPLTERLDRFFLSGIDSSCSKGCFVVNAISEIDSIPESVKEYVRQHVARIRTVFVDALVQAREHGEIAKTVHVEHAADMLLLMLNGTQVMKRMQAAAAVTESIKKSIRLALQIT